MVFILHTIVTYWLFTVLTKAIHVKWNQIPLEKHSFTMNAVNTAKYNKHADHEQTLIIIIQPSSQAFNQLIYVCLEYTGKGIKK